MAEQPEYGTSHISIVDAEGHAVAMTSTIEDGFGSRLMVNVNPALAGGFLLNNELTDFSFLPKDASGTPVANRVQAGKRPRSSMSPTLVFDKSTGTLLVNTGSPGGGHDHSLHSQDALAFSIGAYHLRTPSICPISVH